MTAMKIQESESKDEVILWGLIEEKIRKIIIRSIIDFDWVIMV